ncbi:loader and inhibitor of G40P protein [Tissierella praeacuta]|uniref:replicative helicase loader/inhibitor n=1 Tax=Tissierella praeacuta TaxID=43131 RepID=UPI00104C31AC|nr:replicative helicase loader/inhibitor [Tissierella praeacuta]TCU72894.1 loader and inhibitor of G40P protein [Tissierella praeacuta]
MRKSEVIKLLGMISGAYPNMKEITDLTVDIWYDCLKDMDIEVALLAIKKHILESPFPPSVSDIRKQLSEVTTPENERLDGASGWGEVIKAIKEYGYYREKEALESMTPVTRKVVKYMGWQEICHSEKPDVVRGQFLKMYEIVGERERQSRLLPLDFKEEITRIVESRKVIVSLIDGMDMEKRLDFKE